MVIIKNPISDSKFINESRFFRSAREAWKSCLKGLKPKRVLIPAYIGYTEKEGSGVMDPIDELNVEYSFYKVNENLTFDFSSIEFQINRNKDIDVVLIIHYFGWPAGDLGKISHHCIANGITLVEDCSHAYQWKHPNQVLGKIGDFAFYSVHKCLPVNSGGILESNKMKFPATMEPEMEMEKSVLKQVALAQLDLISKIRNINFDETFNKLKEVNGITIVNNSATLVPQSFPILINNSKNREKLYFHLKENGIESTALYYRLHGSINLHEFPVSKMISNKILNLPIHQEIEEFQIGNMIEIIKNFIVSYK